ncbi:hypothetical protein [Bordetella genomosp. 13]|uniref:hypothetical protein n=1 Tax=Bordetella genomosp. 13 TaxID=463040 RepID=UPI0011A4E1AA|nr:hypothetical protein [Bordetella genomosp. 13]
MALDPISSAPAFGLLGANKSKASDAADSKDPIDRALKQLERRLQQIMRQMQQVRDGDIRKEDKASQLQGLNSQAVMIQGQIQKLMQAKLKMMQAAAKG